MFIDNLIITSDIKLNLLIFNFFESYKLKLTLVAKLILEVFYNKFIDGVIRNLAS